MKDLKIFDKSRIDHLFFDMEGQDLSKNGMFEFFLEKERYCVVASSNDGWDHVSVSHASKIPSPSVMTYFKNKFFEKNETAFEFFPLSQDYVSMHDFCLHLWRPQNQTITLPDPKPFVNKTAETKFRGAKTLSSKPHIVKNAASNDFECLIVSPVLSNQVSWNACTSAKNGFFGDVVAFKIHPAKGTPLAKFNAQFMGSEIIWKSLKENVQTPPTFLVGLKDVSHEQAKQMADEGTLIDYCIEHQHDDEDAAENC
ncbi:MAG: hypothetical protein IJW24_00050 [Clostridia bacterium]|nr:hypothetical protein [Clostridia bacterium]